MKKLMLFTFLAFAGIVLAQNKKSEVIKIRTSAECDECKVRIESNLRYEKGVKFCKLDVPSQMLSVTYNAEKTSPEKIRIAVSKLGYDADEVMANTAEYEKLPECCKKGGKGHK